MFIALGSGIHIYSEYPVSAVAPSSFPDALLFALPPHLLDSQTRCICSLASLVLASGCAHKIVRNDFEQPKAGPAGVEGRTPEITLHGSAPDSLSASESVDRPKRRISGLPDEWRWFINRNAKKIARIRLSVISNQVTNLNSNPAAEEIEGIPCQLEIWDLERLERLKSSGQDREPIEVNFVDRYGSGLQCLEAPNNDPELQSFLLVIPGQVLADLYNEYGARLLVPILFKSQEEALRQAHAVAQNGSLIPADKSYRQFVKIFEKEMLSAGLGKSHGARHHYAQRRYEQMTGFRCVSNGGLPPSKMYDSDRQKDEAARQVISRELGHERKQIVSVYLGG